MKKMYKYIMTVAIVLGGLLQFTSCNDANEWAVDPSLVKQRPPTSFKMDVDDIRIPSWKGTIGTVAGAKSYEVQMSKSPLSSNGNLPVGGEIYTMIVNYTGDGDLEIDRESSTFPRLQWGNTYYFRVRANGEDGTVSNWFTNGKLYNGGVTDEALEKKLIEHTYEKSSDYNSYAMITVHPLMWINSADISDNFITVRWHEIKSDKQIRFLRIGEDGELVDISNVASTESHPEYENVKAYNYTFDDLEPDTEYSFYLLDEDETVLAQTTATTETAPVMEWALKINDWGTITEGSINEDNDLTVRDATGKFIVEIDSNGKKTTKIKTESGKSDAYVNPEHIMECPMVNGMRLTTGGKDGSMTLTLPAATGRLYVYTHVGSSGAGRKMLVQRKSDEKEVELLPPNSKISGKDASGSSKTGYVFQKVYINDEDIDKENNKVTVKVTWDASIYICGFCFVPWEAIPDEE